MSPLLRVANVGDISVIKMLLMGDVPEGNMAYHWCLSGGSGRHEPRIVCLLLKNAARIFQRNKLGLTPVHGAVAKFTMFQEDLCVGT